MTLSAPSPQSRNIAAQHPPVAIIAATLTGPWAVDVGSRSFAVPEGSRVVHAEHEPIAYVLDPAGGCHVLTERGELSGLRPDVTAAIRRLHFSETQ